VLRFMSDKSDEHSTRNESGSDCGFAVAKQIAYAIRNETSSAGRAIKTIQ
jgi:hypothetical protein